MSKDSTPTLSISGSSGISLGNCDLSANGNTGRTGKLTFSDGSWLQVDKGIITFVGTLQNSSSTWTPSQQGDG